MFNSISYLKGSKIIATDGEIGHVLEAFFDDAAWTIRYLVVDAGAWMSDRDVLISPYAVVQPLGSGKIIEVALTRQRVLDSPPVDTHKPVSRQHERQTLDYYTFPQYWNGNGLWGPNALPLLPPPLPTTFETEAEAAQLQEAVPEQDTHLRSSAIITGYTVQASNDSIGEVVDFIFDDESWQVRYLVVDPNHWWPCGRKVLLSVQWVDRIDWADRTVFTPLTRDQVRKSPEYDDPKGIDRDFEQRLHDAYDRESYWD
jgi:hypothetical protein